jgi:hypothetical protein
MLEEYPKVWKDLSKLLKADKAVWKEQDLRAIVENPANFEESQECLEFGAREMLDIYNLVLAKKDMTVQDLYRSIPVALWDAGYDVWIDGNRGTTYNRGHVNADISQKEYWDFTTIDMGI